MQTIDDKYDPVQKIEILLDEVFKNLSTLTEENFDEKFVLAINKMQAVREIKVKNGSKFNILKSSKKSYPNG